MIGNHDFLRIVLYLILVRSVRLIAKALLGTMRVLIAHDEEERLLVGAFDELLRLLSHEGDVALLGVQSEPMKIERRVRPHMELADQPREVARVTQEVRQPLHPRMTLLAVWRMLQAIHAVLMGIESAKDARPAR